jgi:hypothetical protein
VSYLSPGDRPPGGGLWLADEFLWDCLPRLTPLAAYVYLAVGRHASKYQYPTVRELAVETLRSEALVRRAVDQLAAQGLLNSSDLAVILRPTTPGETPDSHE